MSCPFYWWNYHYACRKSGKDVNEDTYDRYCKSYSYSDCPVYKGNDSSSGCFLTSACVEAEGLPDNCYELTMLRAFRDGYMRETESGTADICEYYHTAPAIVENIRKQDNAGEIFHGIYEELVLPCVKLIEAGKNKETHELYRNYVKKLQTQFL